jgi:transaldolase
VDNLSRAGVRVNVTAVLTLEQVKEVAACLEINCPSFVSVFAGRIADTSRDPIPVMAAAVRVLESLPSTQLIWASPRELLNIYHAEEIGCHVITITSDILKKLPLIGKDLNEYSLGTVRMFYDDAQRAGFTLVV